MANYEAPFLNVSVITTFRTAGLLFTSATAALTRRIQIYEIEFGQAGALNSTDIQNLWDVSRCATAAAAGSAVVPSPLDPSDTSPASQFLNNLTTEPTAMTGAGLGLSIKQWAINQRGSYRWRALDDGDNILIPNVAANAIAIRELSGSGNAGQTAMGNVSFVER